MDNSSMKMEEVSSSLATLELYVNELFSGTASKEQVQKIHHALEKFSRQKGAWKDGLYFLGQTTNPQIAMYSLTLLEGFIVKGWNGIAVNEQTELRTSLYQWILEKHQYAPYFIRNKAIQLIVHIARTDWPENYPDFYNDILHLISSSSASTTVLGLLFLQTTSEELGTPKENLLYSRRTELRRRLLELIPQTLAILTGLLENIWEKRAHSLTSTPPPSPTNPLPPGTSTTHPHLSTSSHSLNSEAEPVARLALQCLTHIFSWIPLSNHVTPQLMELIFRFVGMGTDQTLPLLNTSNELSVPVVALGTVNEILYKNCVPIEFESFVILLFNNCCIILHHLVNNNLKSHLPQQPCPQFMEKLIELVHLLISNHLRRLEGRHLPQFSVAQFLSLFFSFTFEQTDWNRYASCLDTWQVFLSHVKESHQNSSQNGTQPPFNGESMAFRYQDSLVTLSEHVLRKSLFTHNVHQLEELDDEATDGNMETERQRMVLQSFEVFVMAGELVRNQTLSLLSEPFQRCTSAYQSLVSHSLGSNGVIRLDSEAQLKEMLIAMKDLATLVQLIGRLSELHTGPDFCANFEVGKSLVLKLVDLASCGATVASLKFVGVPSTELKSTLFLVHAQVLSSLHAWCHWISIWAHSDGPKEQINPLVSALVTSVVDVFSPTWSNSRMSATSVHEVDDKVYQAGLQLLSSVVGVIRTSDLWSFPLWNQIYQSVHEINYLPPKIHRELMRYVFGSTIMTWRNCTPEKQHWEDRQARLSSALGQATHTTRIVVEAIRREPSNQLLAQGKPTVISTVTLLADLAGFARDETTASKVAVSSVLCPWIEPTLLLLSFYINDSEVTEAIFHFYVAVFNGLLNQVGIALAEKAIQTFLETFNQQSIQATLQQNGIHGVRAVEQLLRILQIVVQEPGNAFKRFLPNTLSLCLDHVYPCIGQITSSDLKETFYKLLTMILHHHWRWFFKGSVLATLGSRELDRTEQVENQAQFIAIMTYYGQSFLLPDIAIFKQNLEALENLNSKWKLYQKAIFRGGIANQFINTLLNVLADGSHELLREEIGLAIYAMASPDFEGFFQHLLPNYLLHCQGIEDYQRLELKSSFSNDMDLPSFTQNLYRLTNDLRCFRSTNISNANLYLC